MSISKPRWLIMLFSVTFATMLLGAAANEAQTQTDSAADDQQDADYDQTPRPLEERDLPKLDQRPPSTKKSEDKPEPGTYVEGELLVVYADAEKQKKAKKDKKDKIKKVAKERDGSETRHATLEVEKGKEEEKKKELEKRADVEAIGYNNIITPADLQYAPNDEYTQRGYQNNLLGSHSSYGMRLFTLWDKNRTWAAGQWSNIAIIDTGADINLSELKNALPYTGRSKIQDYYNFCDNNRDVTDDDGHGTAMASIATAHWNNTTGMSGVAPLAQLYVYKHDCRAAPGTSTEGIMRDATIYASSGTADTMAHTISMSFKQPNEDYNDPAFQQAILDARDKGSLIVAAAGNDENTTYDTNTVYPAYYTGAYGVAWALDRNDTTTVKSRCGPHVDFSAPGNNIYALRPGTNTPQPISGTSAATAAAAGVGAIMHAGYGGTARQRAQHMGATAYDFTSPSPPFATGYDQCSGYGRLDTYNAAWLLYPTF